MLLGVDIGTSSVKVAVFDLSGGLVSSASESYIIDIPQHGFAEQSPEIWWRACCNVLRSACAELKIKICGVGLSGQMHGLVCLDERKKILRPAIIWADQRSTAECAEINEYLEKNGLIKKNLNRVSPGFLFPSLLWLFRNERAIAQRIAHVMLPKDYIRYRLTGEICSESSDASATGMFDVLNKKWLFELSDHFEIPSHIFPKLIESCECAGKITSEAAEATGLAVGTPVAGGGGDQPMQSLGNGIIDVGRASSNIGTAGQFCAPLNAPLFDKKLRTNTFCHAAPDRWYLLGANLSAGHSLQWLWKTILGENDYSKATEAAKNSALGANKLLWFPWLNGDRIYNAPDASAVFFGLTAAHSRSDMVRAVMEGVVFSLRLGFEIVKDLSDDFPNEIIASGGGARSEVWRQIQADIYNLPVMIAKTEEQACLGAAITGGVSAKIFADVREGCEKMVKFCDQVLTPGTKNAVLYDELFEIWREFYPRNAEIFTKLNQISYIVSDI